MFSKSWPIPNSIFFGTQKETAATACFKTAAETRRKLVTVSWSGPRKTQPVGSSSSLAVSWRWTKNHGYWWDFHGMFMGCSWDFHGIFMGFSWDFHGIFMGCSWDFHGIFMGFSWDFHGIFMGCSWDFHGIFMGCSWDVHGMFMGCSWDFHGIFMGFSWDFHGIFMGFSWDFHGIFMGFSWTKNINVGFDVMVLICSNGKKHQEFVGIYNWK